MKIALISSTGGHWSQLLQIYSEIQKSKPFLKTELITERNETSSNLKCKFLHQQDRKNKLFLFILLSNCIRSFLYAILYRPTHVISTGAGSVVPYLIFAKLLGAKIIFIESFAKVSSPTLTGKIVYKFADQFYVQWPEMIKIYSKAMYKGSLY